MEKKIYEALTLAFQDGKDADVIRHCEALMVAVRSRLTLESIKQCYESKKEE